MAEKLLAHVELGPRHVHVLLMKFLSAHSSSLFKSLRMAAQPPGVPKPLPAVDVLRMCCAHLAGGHSLAGFPRAQVGGWLCSAFLSVIWMQGLNVSLSSLLMKLNWEVLLTPWRDERPCGGKIDGSTAD